MKIFRLLLCAFVTFALVAPARAATTVSALYGSTAAGSGGELYILDPTTGNVVQDVGPLNDVTALNYGMTGLAFHPITGVMYGSTHNLSTGVPATLARLVTINPATALVTVIGAFNAGNAGRPATMTDLAFDAAGNLFGVASIGGPQLYSINIATGQATVIGGTGLTSTTGGGLAVNSAGLYYGTPTASLFGTYNSTTGAYTDIANPTKPVGGGYGALDFDENGVLYGLNVGSGSPPPTHLVTINPTTGVVTDIGASVGSLDAIAFGPALVPEPSTMALVLVSAVLGVVLNARRRRQ